MSEQNFVSVICGPHGRSNCIDCFPSPMVQFVCGNCESLRTELTHVQAELATIETYILNAHGRTWPVTYAYTGWMTTIDLFVADLTATRIEKTKLEAERDAALRAQAKYRGDLAGAHNTLIDTAEELGRTKRQRDDLERDLQAANQRADDAVAALPAIVNGERIGQFIFNFLEWLRNSYLLNNEQSTRMADPFYIDDADLTRLWNEYRAIRQPKESGDARWWPPERS